MPRPRLRARAWHHPFRFLTLAALASVSTLLACSEMPTSAVDEADSLDEALLAGAQESNRFFSVKLIGPVGNEVEFEATVTWPQNPYGTTSYRYVAYGAGTQDRGTSTSTTFRFRVGKRSRSYPATIRVQEVNVQAGGYSVATWWLRFQVPANGIAPLEAKFTFTCNGFVCDFDASGSTSPSPIVSYDWSFGDGTRATGIAPTHTYSRPGRFHAVLTIRDSQGGVGRSVQRVFFRGFPPVADFTSTCSGLSCAFDGSASTIRRGRIASYEWDFGDGTTATGVNAAHSYGVAGTYDVKLIAKNQVGQPGTVIKQVTVSAANQAPTASFTNSCTDLDCTFDGSASADADGSVASYAWDFGDGNTATGAAPPHSFASAGPFDVTLTVTDNQGATGTDTQQVTVVAANQSPTASFTTSCTDLDCTFDGSASSDPDGSIATYAWDFGDGNTDSGPTASHSYVGAGTFDVTLTVTDDQGLTGIATQPVMVMPGNQSPTASFTSSCTDLDCSFDGSTSDDPDGSIASYAWDFGDGNAGTGVAPAHTYAAAGTYDVVLTVTDDLGATGTDTQQVTVTAANQAPVATFTSSCSDLTCSLDGSGSSDPDGSIAGYVWDFGDGNTGTTSTPSHTFSTAGTYAVTLTVTDDLGATDTDTQQVTVTAPNQSPTAMFAVSCGNLNCDFDGSASNDADGSIASYAWDFGDLNSGTGPNPSHSYASAGTYTVVLTVTDDQGATGTDSQQITVIAPATGVNQLGLNIVGEDPGDQFGRSVAMSDNGTRIVAGAPTNSDGASNAGHVRAFDWTGSSWVQVGQDLDGSFINELRGTEKALDISGNGQRVALGFPRFSSSFGSVTVYELAGNSWVQVGQTLTSPAQSMFGVSVAMSTSGNRLAVGAQNGAGRAEVYELIGNTWTLMGSSIDGLPADQLGYDVSLSGDGTRLLASALGASQLRVFDWNGSMWTQTGGDIQGHDSFGQNVAMSRDGQRIAGYSAVSGDYAAVYQLVGGTWTQMGSDFPASGAFNTHQNLGFSANGGRFALGGFSGGTNGHGIVQIFDWTGSSWVQVGADVEGDHTVANLGWSISMSADGGRVAAGMPFFDNGSPSSNTGAVKVYTIN